MDTLQNLSNKIEGAKEIRAVVAAMKAMSASNIVLYEEAVRSLAVYYHTVALGILAYLKAEKVQSLNQNPHPRGRQEPVICAIVFGSDQGLVGRFNDSMADFVKQNLMSLSGKKEIWVIGERLRLLLSDLGFSVTNSYPVPGERDGVTALVTEILNRSLDSQEKNSASEYFIFHHQQNAGQGYIPVVQRFLPLDEKWKQTIQELRWPTSLSPQIAGNPGATLFALIREYLFVSLFKACVESLSSENASRLEAMQRAEKNISDLLEDLGKKYHSLRQNSIDEELFDVLAGFEALKKAKKS